MRLRGYDRRMSPYDNWRFGAWRPFVCWAKGHDITCYGLTPGRGIISGYFTVCHRCAEMSEGDSPEPCGRETCQNTCKPWKSVNDCEFCGERPENCWCGEEDLWPVIREK